MRSIRRGLGFGVWGEGCKVWAREAAETLGALFPAGKSPITPPQYETGRGDSAAGPTRGNNSKGFKDFNPHNG
jgi:hypothetical protein